MKAEDGKMYAEITLRDVVEKNDVSDMPLLAEVKRLYDENAKLRELCKSFMHCRDYDQCDGCPSYRAFEPDDNDCALEQAYKELRELGIEVPHD